jgi:hypothetical protein
MVVHACNANTWEDKAGRSHVWESLAYIVNPFWEREREREREREIDLRGNPITYQTAELFTFNEILAWGK